MTTIATSPRSDVTTVAHQPQAANGLALVRVSIGAMFVWVFFENLGKGLYTPAGYAGLINYYLKASHCPAAWKAVMGLAANHAAIAAPMQGVTEIDSNGLVVRLKFTTKPAQPTFVYREALKRIYKAFNEKGIQFANNSVMVQTRAEPATPRPTYVRRRGAWSVSCRDR